MEVGEGVGGGIVEARWWWEDGGVADVGMVVEEVGEVVGDGRVRRAGAPSGGGDAYFERRTTLVSFQPERRRRGRRGRSDR